MILLGNQALPSPPHAVVMVGLHSRRVASVMSAQLMAVQYALALLNAKAAVQGKR